MPDTRFRLPRPWRIREHAESFEFVAADGRSVQLYLYFADGERGRIMQRPTRAEAERIAQGILRRVNEGAD